MSIYAKLAKIQQEIKCHKGQRNNFGNYNYRSVEDIQEAVKPLLGDLFLHVSDEIVLIGDRYYVKATAVITDGEREITNSAYAREAENKKGMDPAQLTGATSSYARKYALGGLLLLDDTKDADSQDNTQQGSHNGAQAQNDDDKPWFNDSDLDKFRGKMIEDIQNGKPADQIIKSLRNHYKVSKKMAGFISDLEQVIQDVNM